MTHFFISLFAFIVAIGILVVFHEFGHFWVARRLGVKVLRFSVGFGKPLFKWRDKAQTEYVIAAIPLGGYVKMLDEREETVAPQEQPFAFNRKPVWVRFLIVLAGPVFNFLFAILAYWGTYMIGITGWVPKIGEIVPHSIAADAGMIAEEEVVKIDGVLTSTWSAATKQILRRLGDKEVLVVETQDQANHHTYYLNLSSWELKGHRPDPLYSLGLIPYSPPTPSIVNEVLPGEPAAEAGIQAGDVITTVNGKSIATWQEFTHIVRRSAGKTVHIMLERHEQTLALSFVPRARESDEGEVVGYVGVKTQLAKMPPELVRKERLAPVDAFLAALSKTKEYAQMSLTLIGKMLIGKVGLHNLSGPITIAQGAGASAIVGFQYYLGFLALISISLGVLNLLPIPILDGGHLLYYLLEMITGKPVPERIQFYGFKLGLLVLIFLMTIAFYNDLVRLF